MAKKSKDTLKNFFRTGLRPTQENFADLIDAMTHSETDIFISADQKVGIGTTAPKQKLDVNGAIQVGALVNDADKTAGTIEFSSSKFRGFDGTNWKDLGGGGGGGTAFWDKVGAEPLNYKDEVAIPIDPNNNTGKINLRLGDNSNGTKIEVFGRPAIGGQQPISIGIGSKDESKLIFHLNKLTPGLFQFLNDKPENAGSEQLMVLTDLPRLQVGKTAVLPDLSIEVVSSSRRTQPASGCISGTGAARVWTYLMADSGASNNSGLYWKKGKDFVMAAEASIPANSNNAASTDIFLKCRSADATVEIKKLEIPIGGTFTNLSDIRLKTDMVPFTRGLEVINQIKTFHYRFKSDKPDEKGSRHLGISAQDLQALAPELVMTSNQTVGGENSDYLTVRSLELVYLAFSAIQELSARVKHLEKELKEIKEGQKNFSEA